MRRRALLVGVSSYQHFPSLSWCNDDALAVGEVLQYHANHEPNFDCHLLLDVPPKASPDIPPSLVGHVTYGVTFNELGRALEELFAFEDMVLFYFSGHGYPSERGRYLVTQDGTATLPGILMNDLLQMANNASAREVLLIIDSCFAGGVGEPDHDESERQGWELPNIYLREGVTVLAAARPDQPAIEIDGHGVFTRLLLGSLKGGAADVRGWVSAAAVYAYIEQALSAWQQRPVYKSNASQLSPIRYCPPDIDDAELRQLPRLFLTPEHQYIMDPSFEITSPDAISEHVRIFRLFKRYQVARLLRPSFAFDADLFFVAIRRHSVELTPLGQFYWQLAKEDRISGSLSFAHFRRSTMYLPDAESVAKLFHETYERLAPYYSYETRIETRVPWEQVEERNKRLMIAVATEVLATLFPLPQDDGSGSAVER